MADFDKNIANLISRTQQLSDAETQKVLGLLKKTQERIASRLVATDWDAYAIPKMEKAVKSAVSQFSKEFSKSLLESVKQSWTDGLSMVEGADIVQTAIPKSALEILQGYSADRITNMSEDLISKINDEIAVSVTGGQSLQEAMKRIGNTLDSPGIFKTFAARAEAIARTEIATIQSSARQRRAEEVMSANPDKQFIKTWLHSGKIKNARQNHLKLNRVTIPVNMDFSKTGLPMAVPKGQGFAYPHAPGMPANEVVFCGCVHIVKLKEKQIITEKYKDSEKIDLKKFKFDELLKKYPEKSKQLYDNQDIWEAIDELKNIYPKADLMKLMEGDKLLGASVFNVKDLQIEIEYLATNPENIVGLGTKGTGTSLIAEIAKKAKQNGLKEIKLKSLEGAKEFYKKLGFKEYPYSTMILDESGIEKLIESAQKKGL